ncbi:hypothetical protein [Chryseobacterium indoltheticum]
MDERKRYFFANDDYKKIRFEKIVQKMQDELKLMDDLKNFRKTEHKEDDERIEVYKALLNKSISNIQESLNKL